MADCREPADCPTDRPVNTIRLSGQVGSLLRQVVLAGTFDDRSAPPPVRFCGRDRICRNRSVVSRESSPPICPGATESPRPRHGNVATMAVVDGTCSRHVSRARDRRMVRRPPSSVARNHLPVTCLRTGSADRRLQRPVLVKLVGEHAPKLALVVTHRPRPGRPEGVAGAWRATAAPTRRQSLRFTGPLSRRPSSVGDLLRRDPSARAHPGCWPCCMLPVPPPIGLAIVSQTRPRRIFLRRLTP